MLEVKNHWIHRWTWLRKESAWRYVNRNFQNWKAKRKNERKETKTTEYPRTVDDSRTVDDYKRVLYAQWNIRRQRKRKGTAEIFEVLITENFSKLMTKPNHSSRNTKHIPFGLEIMFNHASPDISSLDAHGKINKKINSVSQETSAYRFPSPSS